MTVGPVPQAFTSSPAAEAAGRAHPAPAKRRPLRDGLSFRSNLLVGIGALVLFTGAALIFIAGRSSRAATSALAASLFRETSGHAVTHARDFVESAMPLVESLGRLGEGSLALDNSDRLAAQLLAVLPANPGITWLSYSDEAGTFTGVYRTPAGGYRVNQSRIVDGRTRLVEHDVLPNGSWRAYRRDDDSGYDPRARPFYREARRAGALVWLPPYVFFDAGVPGITCAKPVYNGAGNLRGVFTADFDLNTLSQFVAGLHVSDHSQFFVFTEDGILLAHPGTRVVAGEGRGGVGQLLSLKDVQDPLVDAYRRNLPRNAIDIGAGRRFQSFRFQQGGADYLASATAFRVGGDSPGAQVWLVGALAPEADFLGGIRRGQRIALAVAGAALLLAIGLASLLAGRISGPVCSLVDFMGRVGDGQLDSRIDLGGSREFRQLSTALNRMIEDLRDRLRLRHSLNVAMEVQQRLLPQRPPSVPGLDLAGHSTYCDETGGDYYDYLVLDQPAPRGALIALGDVMGHGVSAALVMAGARAVLRTRASAHGNLAKMSATLNRLLCEDLGGERFMTMHLSYVDLDARVYRWCSAGHDPAFIFDPRRRAFDEIDAGDLPLGVMEDTSYNEASYPLSGGEVIIIGTDGIWETVNAAGEQFGKQRLRDAALETIDRPASEIVEAIVRRLNSFRGGPRPEDDVTLVVIRVVSLTAAGIRVEVKGDD
jgi:sigma-B regulation protein RsbU (phosphoserine phosphatase)